jgi:cytidyltransferase-like protein
MKIVLCTGGYDPVHSGHLAYFQAARELGDKLVVGLNSDEWLARKKGKPFMPMSERFALTAGLRVVDEVITFDDQDGSSCDAIVRTRLKYPDAEIIFANGGDRTQENIPEMRLAETQVSFAFGVGGTDKKNSSSWILEDWKKPKTERTWGYYRVLHEVGSNTKLKELTVAPKTCLSMQQHAQRQEFWFVAEGVATVYTLYEDSTDADVKCQLEIHEHTFIECREWHQLCNETDQPLKLIEIQYGSDCVETDIVRK